jgi:hypothetical protein
MLTANGKINARRLCKNLVLKIFNIKTNVKIIFKYVANGFLKMTLIIKAKIDKDKTY